MSRRLSLRTLVLLLRIPYYTLTNRPYSGGSSLNDYGSREIESYVLAPHYRVFYLGRWNYPGLVSRFSRESAGELSRDGGRGGSGLTKGLHWVRVHPLLDPYRLLKRPTPTASPSPG